MDLEQVEAEFKSEKLVLWTERERERESVCVCERERERERERENQRGQFFFLCVVGRA